MNGGNSMLENLTDEQVKMLFAIVIITPMIISAVAYWAIEKIRSKPVIIKEVRK